jgi:ProP effector
MASGAPERQSRPMTSTDEPQEQAPPPTAAVATEAPPPATEVAAPAHAAAPQAGDGAAAQADDAAMVEAAAEVASAPPSDAAAEATPTKATPDLSPAATGARLAELFPALFVGPDGNGTWKAIKLRIHADIQARAPGQFSKRALGIFFSRYTTTTAYLKALAAPGAQRFDLDGQPAGEIAEEHRSAAAEEVERRRAIAIERRAAYRKGPPPGARPALDATPDSDTPAAPAHTQRPPRPPRRENDPRRERRDDGPRRGGPPARGPRDEVRGARPAPFEPRQTPRERPAPAAPALPADPAQRERALLLRAFESSPLSKANFCALKRISEAELDRLLAQAQAERRT